MRIIIVGNGLIGRAVAEKLRSDDHDVIIASRSDPVWPLDITSPDSIRTFLKKAGRFDALACAAGEAWIGPFAELTLERLNLGWRSKLGGQLSLVLESRNYIHPRGSLTLISGFLSEQPVAGTSTLTAVNGAINAFVRSAAAEMRPIRINAVSPGLIQETADQMGAASPPGVKPILLQDVVWAYRLSILGIDTGRVLAVH